MSRGGFRGGRGGGRGGFGRGQIDVELQGLEYSFHDVPLFPDMQFPAVFKELAPAERELLDTDKKWITAFKELPYHIEAPIVRDEIERYSDRFKSWLRPKNKSLTLIPTDLMFFPDELQQVKDPSKKPVSKTSKGGFDLEKRLRELEKEESSKKGKTVCDPSSRLPPVSD
ncbi:hypothetical protein BC830DRAFT_1138294 [Chytriomyces sp. MP71]|nr:hypothetical protein BC830DRAFT_1138294 [Chytriomyces sp. MP71]